MLVGGAAPKSASILLMLLGPGAAKKRPKVQIWRQSCFALTLRRGRWFGRDDVTNQGGTTP